VVVGAPMAPPFFALMTLLSSYDIIIIEVGEKALSRPLPVQALGSLSVRCTVERAVM
jgi:hypothetical protein